MAFIFASTLDTGMLRSGGQLERNCSRNVIHVMQPITAFMILPRLDVLKLKVYKTCCSYMIVCVLNI